MLIKINRQNSIIIILLISTAILQGQTLLSWNEVKEISFGNETIYKKRMNDSLLNGDYKIAANTGSYSEVSFVNGKVNGLRTEYDGLGRKYAQATFQNGIIVGKSLSFHQNGKVMTEEFYKDGKPEGTWKRYNEEDRVIKIENYKSGKKEGKWVKELYYPQDKTTTIETQNYKDDQPTGRWELRTDEKVLIWEKNYKGPKEFIRKTYHPNGKLEKHETHVNNVLNGPYEKYTSKGIKVVEGNFEDGLRSGLWKEFENKKGRLKSEVNYKKDKKNGVAKYYNKAHNLEETGNYQNNRKEGLWKYYDLAGDLKREVKYENGGVASEKIYN